MINLDTDEKLVFIAKKHWIVFFNKITIIGIVFIILGLGNDVILKIASIIFLIYFLIGISSGLGNHLILPVASIIFIEFGSNIILPIASIIFIIGLIIGLYDISKKQIIITNKRINNINILKVINITLISESIFFNKGTIEMIISDSQKIIVKDFDNPSGIVELVQKIKRINLKNIQKNKENNWKNIINKHIAVLSKKHKILYSKDDYGIIKKDKWYKEVKYFLDTVNLNINNEDEFEEFIEILHDEIDEYNDSIKSENDELEFDKNMSPNDYEYYCKDILVAQGIDARVTKQSGDQGVDVIVHNKNNEIVVVIQCKLYSSAVGNKAVQEVYSAKQHFGAKFAMVVTNNTYTKSAIELSNTTGVKLLHHEDLKDFSKILDIK